MVTRDLESDLLGVVGAFTVDMTMPPESRAYMLGSVRPPEPEKFVTLDDDNALELILASV